MKVLMSKKNADSMMKHFKLDKLPDHILVMPDKVQPEKIDIEEVERMLNTKHVYLTATEVRERKEKWNEDMNRRVQEWRNECDEIIYNAFVDFLKNRKL